MLTPKEKKRLNSKRHYQANRKARLEQIKLYQRSHRAEYLAYRIAWRAKNADRERQRNRLYYQRNKAAKAAYQKEYVKTHRLKRRLCYRRWQAKNKEHLRQYRKKWLQKHRERLRQTRKEKYNPEKRRAYNERTKEHHKTQRKRYFEEKPFAPLAYVHRRRARLKAATVGKVSRKDLDALFDKVKDCPYCGVRLTRKNRSLDHIIPLKRGGPHTLDNLTPACRSCNSRKQAT